MSISNVFRFAFLSGLVMSSTYAVAASHCKGLAENACATDQTCAWVQGYTRKDGRAVSSHCRIRRGKGALNISATKSGQPPR